MTDTRHFRLVHDEARQRAIQAIKDAPDGYLCKIRPPTRSLDQNAKLHALFSDLAEQCTHFGRKLTADQWKVLMISGHSIATGLGADMIPGLEGEYVNVRESSANMTVARMSSLIEYIHAYMAEHAVAA